MKNKILIISPYCPYPARDGGKVRLYNLIKHLSNYNDVYLLAYTEPEADKSFLNEETFCKKIFTVERNEDLAIYKNDIPRCVSFFYTQAMIEKLAEVLKEVKPDAVQIDFLVMTQYAKHITGYPVYYTEHDMSTIDFKQSFHDRDLEDSLRFIEWKRLVAYEREILKYFKEVIVLTERDKKILKEFAPAVKTEVIPTGVDTEYFTPKKNTSIEKALVYVGHYKHYPNADAVAYFVRDILPKILEKKTDTKLYIVGSGLTKQIEALADNKNIFTTGELADIRHYLGLGNIFVAPVRLGGGVKGKVLEAMASGMPVVSTREAADGIDCADGKNILVARDETDFALKILNLLDDNAQYESISKAARNLALEKYSWQNIAKKLSGFYKENL
jgi:glycosyltransferase involved in cell wall biosynthesis